MVDEYRIGDLVWVKMKGYPWWPSVIGTPKEGINIPCSNDPMYFVFFLGANSYRWTATKFINPFEEYEEIHSRCKLASFKIAMEKAQEYRREPMIIGENKYFKPEDYQTEAKCYFARKRTLKKSHASKPNNNKQQKKSANQPEGRKRSEVPHVKIGVLGLDGVGSGIAKKFVYSGYEVTVWNRSPEKLIDFEDHGVGVGRTPSDVVSVSDVTFSCVRDSAEAKEVVFGKDGILREIAGKGYVGVTCVDPGISESISEAVERVGGQFLEAPVFGSQELSNKGKLIVFAAGNKSLFEKCRSLFDEIGDNAFFLGESGNACKMRLTLNLFMNASMAGLIETMRLSRLLDLPDSGLLDILNSEPFRCPLFYKNSRAILEDGLSGLPLQSTLDDMETVLDLGRQHTQPLPTTVAASEVYRRAANRVGDEDDILSIWKAMYNMRPPMHAIL